MSSADVLESLADEVTRLVRVDLRRAEALAEDARRLATPDVASGTRGRIWRAVGHVHYARGRYRSAIRCYRAARAASIAAGRPLDLAITLSGALHALAYVGEYDQAYRWAGDARNLFRALGDRLRLARLDSNEANVLYRQDRFAEALALDQRAYRVFRTHGQPQDLSAVLRNIAVTQTALGQFDRAVRTYRRARLHNQRHDMPLLVAECEYNIAYIHVLRGEYATAATLYAKARAHSVRVGDPYHEALCDLDVAEMSLALNLLDDVIARATEAASRFRSLAQPYERAKALTFLGIALGRCGRSDEAIARLAEARRLFVEEHNREWPSLVDVHGAVVLAAQGRVASAGRLARRASRALHRSAAPDRVALCAVVASRIALARGDASTAAALADRARGTLAETDNPGLAWQAEAGRGLAARAMGDVDAARAHLLEARLHMQRLRQHLHGEESRIAFLGDKHVVLDTLATLALREGGAEAPARALAFVEESKSRSLAELLAVRAGATRVEPLVVEPVVAQSALAPDTAICEYAVLDGRLTLFVVTSQQLRAVDLGPANDIMRRVHLLHFQLMRTAEAAGAPAGLERSHAATRVHLSALHRALIAPARELLEVRQIVVVPHGDLHRVPFHALLDADHRYLGDDYDIVCAPSTSVFHLCATRPLRDTRGALVMGVSDDAAPAIAREASMVAAALPGARCVSGRDATRRELETFGRHVRYLHLATHGWFRRDNPMFSSIRLGDGDLPVFACYDLQLNADLVTLSGCSTGVNATTAADEIVGLTRGLLSAGARAVLLSLWDVHDAPTSDLMTTFYRAIAKGESMTSAHRRAMHAVRAVHPHPAFWAPFVLMGAPAASAPQSEAMFDHPQEERPAFTP